ncbi:MAG: T9SS type A sorting domain-containing protein [Ignavibacteriales bacterium]|nr:MAG: T9SS type A sorting domain-containing protein [Ignavibacteriales bacterium]
MKKTGVTVLILLMTFAVNLFAQNVSSQMFPSKKYSSLLERTGIKFNGNKTSSSEDNNKRSSTTYKVLENGFVLATTVTQLGGGGTWTNYESEKFLYDQDFNLIEALSQVWDGINWINDTRALQTYTASGKLEDKLLQLWNGTDWDDDVKLSYEYNAQDRVSMVTYFSVVQNGVYTPYSRDLLSYSDNPYTETTEIQNMDNGSWLNISKVISVFLDEERVLEQIIYGWDAGSYVPGSKTTFTYENDLLKQTTGFVWGAAQWDSLSKHSYIYDGSGRMIEFTSSSFDSSSNSWQNLFKGNTTYWGSDSAMSVIQQGLENNNWENLFKTRSQFNTAGKLINVLYSDWVNGDWAPQAMSETFYDEHGNDIEYVERSYFNGQWENAGRILRTYIPDNTTGVGDDPVLADGYALYNNHPNPFNPSTVIQYNLPSESFVSIKVYDVTGSEVTELVSGLQSAGLKNITFSARDLSSGVYFYIINAKSSDGKQNFSEVKKMMLVK